MAGWKKFVEFGKDYAKNLEQLWRSDPSIKKVKEETAEKVKQLAEKVVDDGVVKAAGAAAVGVYAVTKDKVEKKMEEWKRKKEEKKRKKEEKEAADAKMQKEIEILRAPIEDDLSNYKCPPPFLTSSAVEEEDSDSSGEIQELEKEEIPKNDEDGDGGLHLRPPPPFIFLPPPESPGSPSSPAGGYPRPSLPFDITGTGIVIMLILGFLVLGVQQTNAAVFGIDSSGFCPTNCSKHGKCLDNGVCKCVNGYTGIDCSTAVCDERSSLHGGVCDNGICAFRCSDYAGYTCQKSSVLMSSLSVCKNVLQNDFKDFKKFPDKTPNGPGSSSSSGSNFCRYCKSEGHEIPTCPKLKDKNKGKGKYYPNHATPHFASKVAEDLQEDALEYHISPAAATQPPVDDTFIQAIVQTVIQSINIPQSNHQPVSESANMANFAHSAGETPEKNKWGRER